jgi:signal transduction histidine kinase
MFEKARLKLTLWYLTIVMVISLFFSIGIFRMVSMEIERFAYSPRFRVDSRFEQENMIKESKGRLLISLLQVNGVILIISGSLGYFLAGRTLSPIEKMLEEQKRFVSDASHELRTPLTALKTTFEVGLRDKSMTLKEARHLISEGIDETNKLKKLSDSLLELAAENTVFQNIKVNDFIIEAIARVQPLAKAKDIRIITKLDNSFVLGNQEKLTEVVTIILDNAIKYSPAHTKIRITAKGNFIKVADQGKGINPQDLPYIFDRFYRSDKSRGHLDEGGYGLGLAIAKKIILEHHGRITVNSIVGKGSQFKIIL